MLVGVTLAVGVFGAAGEEADDEEEVEERLVTAVEFCFFCFSAHEETLDTSSVAVTAEPEATVVFVAALAELLH